MRRIEQVRDAGRECVKESRAVKHSRGILWNFVLQVIRSLVHSARLRNVQEWTKKDERIPRADATPPRLAGRVPREEIRQLTDPRAKSDFRRLVGSVIHAAGFCSGFLGDGLE